MNALWKSNAIVTIELGDVPILRASAILKSKIHLITASSQRSFGLKSFLQEYLIAILSSFWLSEGSILSIVLRHASCSEGETLSESERERAFAISRSISWSYINALNELI